MGYSDLKFVYDSNCGVSVDDYMTCKDAAIVEITAWAGIEQVTTRGCARRHPADKPDEDLALELAFARALEAASKRLLKRANGKVQHADNMQDRKKQSKTRNFGGFKPQTSWWTPEQYCDDCCAPDCDCKDYRRFLKNV